MSSGPVPFRTSNENKYTPSFPSVLYYRDTFGLEPIRENRRFTDSMLTDCSDDTVTTKSTVRNFNIHTNPMMNESMISKMTQSYHVEQLVTNRVLTAHPRTLLILALILFATAVQLLIFSVICLFFDGCPLYIGIFVCLLMILNSLVLAAFVRCAQSRHMLVLSCISASLSFILAVGLFFWNAYLISKENDRPSFTDYDSIAENEGDSGEQSGFGYDNSASNPIVASTRIAMNSLQLVFAPAHAVAAAFALHILYTTVRSLSDQSVVRGYFFSEPTIGHQKILVPIELRQVRQIDDEESDNASIGVQTISLEKSPCMVQVSIEYDKETYLPGDMVL
ncbi:hypothetical protein PMAYCL1PPCAC_02448 [Pristionchus mayeri]|uniref:Transmembrane protein n=1 Tax=Pristionchus mayeri TaxID=1317129 RepID=A0AAN5C0G9_9BILA|nr:hypothetical protein PMAYCL1PPCAC_02448 [Pristionchus mayeri]